MDRWMQKLYWNNDAFKDSTNFEHIKTHYYWSHTSVSSIFLTLDDFIHCPQINPTRVVPLGPVPEIRPL